MEDNRIGLVVMLLREGSYHDAVRVYQDEADIPLPAARRAVQEIAHAHSISTRRSMFSSLLWLTLAGALGAILSMSMGVV